MGEDRKKYQFGTVEDILRESSAEPTEPNREMDMDGGILFTSGIHVYLPRYEINVHEGFFCHMEDGRLVPLTFLTVIYDRSDKEYLYDAEENFVDTVHEWLDGQCTPEQLEQEPCEVRGTREELMQNQRFHMANLCGGTNSQESDNRTGDLDGNGIQTGGSGRNPCGDGTACRSAGRHHGKR